MARSEDWPGEIRPEVGATCAAEAMLTLASLQDKCVERLHTDWRAVEARSQAMVDRISNNQEEYHRLVESDQEAAAGLY